MMVGWEGDSVLKIRLQAAPEKGRANAALIQFLAKALNIAKVDVTLISGHTSRLKRVQIDGLSLCEVRSILL